MRRRIPINRVAKIPDRIRIERYRRTPELGPKILFFSGGSALREVSKNIKEYTFNSCHLMTPFDSGGSSASLREAFAMPSIGDIRNRLCTLADDNLSGNEEIRKFFGFRFAEDGDPMVLHEQLAQLDLGRDPLMESIPQPIRNLVGSHLRSFCQEMPRDFNLTSASLGNLTLAGAYLQSNRDIDAVTYLYSRLLEVRGSVRATVNAHLDLCVQLEDGTALVRQHLFTGKESAAIKSPVERMFLTDRENPQAPVTCVLERSIGAAITEADLICFPMGSFYSSLIANLLPSGVGKSIRRARGPRVYIPNTGPDPEQYGMSVEACVATLIAYLRKDAGESTAITDLLDFVLVDSERGKYLNGIDVEAIEAQGVSVLDLDLVNDEDPQSLDGAKINETLLSLA